MQITLRGNIREFKNVIFRTGSFGSLSELNQNLLGGGELSQRRRQQLLHKHRATLHMQHTFGIYLRPALHDYDVKTPYTILNETWAPSSRIQLQGNSSLFAV